MGTFIPRPPGTSACIFIRGGQERQGKKVLRNTASCLKLLFGDLNFSCLPMSRVCPCGTEHPVQCKHRRSITAYVIAKRQV